MIRPTADPRVWNSVRWLYIGSGVLFLANIGLGVLNVFSGETIGHGQILAHLHAGTIGWVTMSVVATSIWVFTGSRPVSEPYARFTEILTIVGLVSVAGYILAFGAAFSDTGPFWLLPLFGIPTWLVILSALVFTIMQFRQQVVVTTVHLLLFGALLVASLGATMGVLRGLTYSAGISPYPAGGDGLAAHAGPMDMYLALAFAALVELFLRKDDHAKWTKPGMWQMVLGATSAFVLAGAAYVGAFMLAPIPLLLFLASFVIYFVRIGWRAIATNPTKGGRSPAIFFGGLFFPIYFILFVVFVMAFFVPGREPPHWLEVLFVHTTFVGAGTNLLLATQSVYGGRRDVNRRLEPWAYWTLNLGMLLFFAESYADGGRYAALLMGAGILTGIYVVWSRLGQSWEPPGAGPPPETVPPPAPTMEPAARPPDPPSTPPDLGP